MKKLALLMFTILILGCGNENPVSEPNEDLAEIQAIADQLSQAAASLDISAPTITASSVTDGDTDVDPELLNREEYVLHFLSESLYLTSTYTTKTALRATGRWSGLQMDKR